MCRELLCIPFLVKMHGFFRGIASSGTMKFRQAEKGQKPGSKKNRPSVELRSGFMISTGFLDGSFYDGIRLF